MLHGWIAGNATVIDSLGKLITLPAKLDSQYSDFFGVLVAVEGDKLKIRLLLGEDITLAVREALRSRIWACHWHNPARIPSDCLPSCPKDFDPCVVTCEAAAFLPQ